jgi:hypothetical protein
VASRERQACGEVFAPVPRRESLTHLRGYAFGAERFERLSDRLKLYFLAIVAAPFSVWISKAVFVAAALMWLIPDRRIQNVLQQIGD